MKRKLVILSIFFSLFLLGVIFQTIIAGGMVGNKGDGRSNHKLTPDLSPVSESLFSFQTQDEINKSSEFPSVSRNPVPTTVSLRAASGATILFKTQKGRTIKGIPPQITNLSHLVLYRNGVLTNADERTLIITVAGIEIPPPGVTVNLKVKTQHGNPDLGHGYGESIVVWQESRRVQQSLGENQTIGTALFVHEFAETVLSGTEKFPTPTDYFRYEVVVTGSGHPMTNPLYKFSQEYAFLLENQWIAQLPELDEESEGAAPDQLAIYYCDMVPFRKSIHDLFSWLSREDVTKYIYSELAPTMVKALQIQTNDWGFPWSQAWTNTRFEENTKQLSVALTDGEAWYHGAAPALANSQISIRITSGEIANYHTLTEGILSAFHHELFHNLQRNISQKQTGSGILYGAEEGWLFFIEGTAMLATSVGQPTIQFTQTTKARAYMSRANEFLDGGGLNTSYEELLPYRAALYWRFLYEQCGGMRNGIEDPALGMKIIKQTLVTLFSKDIVDINTSTDLVESMPLIMNVVFSNDNDSLCPFNNYEDSLAYFARAIYALKLEGGRCTKPGLPSGCGFYDPGHLYIDPPVNMITYTGSSLAYSGKDKHDTTEIGSSFGIDLFEIILDPKSDGKPLQIEIHVNQGVGSDFRLDLWEITDSTGKLGSQFNQNHLISLETLTLKIPYETKIYLIPTIDKSETISLYLTITRIDTNESIDPIGYYTIVLNPDVDKSLTILDS